MSISFTLYRDKEVTNATAAGDTKYVPALNDQSEWKDHKISNQSWIIVKQFLCFESSKT